VLLYEAARRRDADGPAGRTPRTVAPREAARQRPPREAAVGR
jgi:hypothetical protein